MEASPDLEQVRNDKVRAYAVPSPEASYEMRALYQELEKNVYSRATLPRDEQVSARMEQVLFESRPGNTKSQTALVCSDTGSRNKIRTVDTLGNAYFENFQVSLPRAVTDRLEKTYSEAYGEGDEAKAMSFADVVPIAVGETIFTIDNATATYCPQYRKVWAEFLGVDFDNPRAHLKTGDRDVRPDF